MLVGPDLRRRRVPLAALCAELRAPLEEARGGTVAQVVDGLALPPERAARMRAGLLAVELGASSCGRAFAVRLPAGAGALAQARAARLPARLASLLVAHAAAALLAAWSLVLVGRGALQGRLDSGALVGWALLLVTLVPLRALVAWGHGTFLLTSGALLRRRLLAGILGLEPDALRRTGVGRMLGAVVESEALENVAFAGVLLLAFAVLDLGAALLLLANGLAGRSLAILLAVFLLALVAVAAVLGRRRGRWSAARLALTDRLVERLLGMRTRLAQERPSHWHLAEDDELAGYVVDSRRLDALAVPFASAGRVFLCLGLVLLGTALLSAPPAEPAELALALGGLLLAQRGADGFASGLLELIAAHVAFAQARPLLAAGGSGPAGPSPALAWEAWRSRDAGALVDLRRVDFRRAGRDVLARVSLRLERGDRVLVEGPSGGGKSTLAAMLAGLRPPSAGDLRLDGFERQAWDPRAWRARVALAPQFHDNHLFSASLAFNLLLGRGWPPRGHDLHEARDLCHELGLGPLLERMPAGLHQNVGEGGWQLSHGERGRVFIARALLQRAELVVLDESFAGFDAETLARCLECVTRRAPTLVVIAHP